MCVCVAFFALTLCYILFFFFLFYMVFIHVIVHVDIRNLVDYCNTAEQEEIIFKMKSTKVQTLSAI